ncbi:hypothetical protein FRX31_021903, partial [Thalictrum thalictroides]
MIVEPKLAVMVGQKLTKLMSATLDSHATEDRHHVDYVGMSNIQEFRSCNGRQVYIEGQKMLKTTLRLSNNKPSVQFRKEEDEDRNKMKLNALRIQNITLPSQIDL